MSDKIKKITDYIDKLENDIEQLRVQLAGCGVAALGYYTKDQLVKRKDYGWSQSYEDVLQLRKKYDKLLKELKNSLE